MTDTGLRRIMLVEDEADIQAIARLALEVVGGFTVEVCGDGRAALAKAIEFKPQLILLDVVMPGMDGPAALAALRADDATKRIPVVFLTARADPADIRHLRELGAVGVINKPFDPAALAGTVRQLWTENHD